MEAIQVVADLIESYHEFNVGYVEVIDHEPTPLEFLRIVQKNRPVVIKNALSHWDVFSKWSTEYLKKMIEGDVQVAETPSGNADSVVRCEETGKEYFVKPYLSEQSFAEYLDYLVLQKENLSKEDTCIKYAQSQDDNLHKEFSPLLSDIDEELPWASEALAGPPDAVNIWIGNERSISALHKDNYENLYCVVAGVKRFVLISPLEVGCVGERTLRCASYWKEGEAVAIGCPDGENVVMGIDQTSPDHPTTITKFKIIPDDHPEYVHCWPTIDPDIDFDKPNDQFEENIAPLLASRLRGYCRPLRVELFPGDILYLPALWYHKVSQESERDGPQKGLCIAVNYWYDMDYSGPFYSLCQFVRSVCSSLDDELGGDADKVIE